MKWYMIKIVTGKEKEAIKNIKTALNINNMEDKVESIIIPKEKKFYLRNKKKYEREKPMFPGYLMCKMDVSGNICDVINKSNYVINIMGMSRNKPTPLSDIEVNRVFGNIEKSSQEVDFLEGEKVEITDGPFKSFKGSVLQSDKNTQNVKVSVEIFGRETKIDLSYYQVDKI